MVNHVSLHFSASNPIHLIKCHELPPGLGLIGLRHVKRLHQTAHLKVKFIIYILEQRFHNRVEVKHDIKDDLCFKVTFIIEEPRTFLWKCLPTKLCELDFNH